MPDPPDISLRQAADQQLEHPRLREVLRQHCPYLPPDVPAAALSTAIHEDCQMLEFSLRHHQDAALSVSQYFAVALQQYQIMRQTMQRVFGERQDLRILDFACGYGRLLRFLVHSLPAEHIWAADIQAEAVNYVRQQFGVQALASSAAPEDFVLDQRFDLVWVASLFSHLPEDLFRRWLARLAKLLAPGGILCFSVHGEGLLPAAARLPDSGFLYQMVSENDELSADIYGTSFVSESFVEAALHSAFGTPPCWRRFPQLLAAEQDVYIVARDPDGVALTGLDQFRRGPRGWLDVRRLDARGLYLQGWAASIDDGDLDCLEISLGNETLRIVPSEPRPAVAEVLGDARLAHCGFSCTLPWPDDKYSAYLEISALSRLGERGLVFAGHLWNKLGGG